LIAVTIWSFCGSPYRLDTFHRGIAATGRNFQSAGLDRICCTSSCADERHGNALDFLLAVSTDHRKDACAAFVIDFAARAGVAFLHHEDFIEGDPYFFAGSTATARVAHIFKFVDADWGIGFSASFWHRNENPADGRTREKMK
jgi:hypothetical protein